MQGKWGFFKKNRPLYAGIGIFREGEPAGKGKRHAPSEVARTGVTPPDLPSREEKGKRKNAGLTTCALNKEGRAGQRGGGTETEQRQKRNKLNKNRRKERKENAPAEVARAGQRGQKREDGKREKGRGKREQGRGKRGIAGIPARTGHTENGKQKIPHSTKKRKPFLLPLFCL